MVSVNIVTHFICVLILACFCIIMTMSNWASQFDLQSIRVTLLYHLYNVFFLVGFLSIVYSWFTNARSKEVSQSRLDQHTFLLSFGGMGLFFVAILISDSLSLTNIAFCMESLVSMECDLFKITGFVLSHCSRPIYLGAQLMFIVWIRYTRLNRGFILVSKIAHSINIAVNLSLIIYNSSYESNSPLNDHTNNTKYDFFNCNKTRDGDPVEVLPVHNASCMTSETTLLKLNRSLYPYIFPMQVQFASLAISVMIGQVAISSGHEENTEAVDIQSEPGSDVASTITSTITRVWNHIQTLLSTFLHQPATAEERVPLVGGATRQPSGFSPLLILGLFVCCIHLIAGVVSKRDLSGTIWFVIVINYVKGLSLVVSGACVLKYMYEHTHAVLRTPLPSSAVVILISSACAYNIKFYKLIANADIVARPMDDWIKIKNETRLTDYQLRWFAVSNALTNCLTIVWVVLQSLIIIRICRELSMSRYCLGLTGNVRTSLYYLLVANVSGWLGNSVIDVNLHEYIKDTYYSLNVWKSLRRTFMPGFLYFEFHSFTILSEYMIAQWYHDRSGGERSRKSSRNNNDIDNTNSINAAPFVDSDGLIETHH